MRKKKQESGYYYCECSIHVGSRGAEESKEQGMQTEGVKVTTSEAPSSAAGADTGVTAASCNLALHSGVADNKTSENIAEALIASEEKEINEVNEQPEATDETSLAADEVCSKLVRGLLLSVEEEWEKASVVDGSLQETKAIESAPDVPTSSGWSYHSPLWSVPTSGDGEGRQVVWHWAGEGGAGIVSFWQETDFLGDWQKQK